MKDIIDKLKYYTNRSLIFIIFILAVYAVNVTADKTFWEQNYHKAEKNYNEEVAMRDSLLAEFAQSISNSTKPQTIVEKTIINRGVNYEDVYKIFYNTMLYLGEENPVDFTTLLMVTYIAETDGGQYLFQIGNGYAKGMLQVEPTTEKEIYRVFLARNPELKKKIEALKGIEIKGLSNSAYNIAYNAALAYCVYKWRIPKGVPPNKNDKLMQAQYHKKFYNTIHGAASVENTLAKIGG